MAASHAQSAPPGMECLITLEDIDDSNYCEYQTWPSLQWYPAKAASSAVEYMRKTQFKQFMQRLETTDCAAEMRRLQEKGPPIYVEDANVLPLQPHDTHVNALWYMADDVEVSAKLEGALEGDERIELWEHLKAIHAATLAADAPAPAEDTNSSS